MLKIDRDYTGAELVLGGGKRNYRGFKESDEVSEWLSQILCREVILVRAEPDRVMRLDPEICPAAADDDRRGAFLTDGVIHLINNQSMQALTMKMYNKYSEDQGMLQLVAVDVPTFRPNIVIDEEFDEPYCEEEYQQARIGNILFRQTGPCQRCKTTSLNWRMNIRHPNLEPYTTIATSRKHHKFGPIFGIYLQPDIIPSQEEFRELFPNYLEVRDRSLGQTGIIKKGDCLQLRVRRRTYYIT